MPNRATERVAPDARVLVICVARIGDTLLSTPVLQAIKDACPKGEVTCLSHPKRMSILQGLTSIDRLDGITKKSAWWRGHIGAKRWDYALVYGRDDALSKFALRTAHCVVGFGAPEKNSSKSPLHVSVAPPATLVHAVDERLMLTEALGIRARSKRLIYRVSDQEKSAAVAWIAKRTGNDPLQGRFVGLQFASFPTKAYRDWPTQQVIDLGKRMLERFADLTLLCLGGPDDVQKGDAIASALGGRCINIAGNLSLRENSAVMSMLALYVGVDTGPTHIAGALGIPMVVLYHCRHRGKYLAPLDHPAPLTVIEHPQSDENCSATSLMSDISVDSVWEAAHNILAENHHAQMASSIHKPKPAGTMLN